MAARGEHHVLYFVQYLKDFPVDIWDWSPGQICRVFSRGIPGLHLSNIRRRSTESECHTPFLSAHADSPDGPTALMRLALREAEHDVREGGKRIVLTAFLALLLLQNVSTTRPC